MLVNTIKKDYINDNKHKIIRKSRNKKLKISNMLKSQNLSKSKFKNLL